MSQSIGQRLKQEREVRYVSLEKASDATRIRVVFLQALEADDYSVMPSAAQGRGFLRNYAEYLGLNIDELIAEIQRHPPEEISGPLPSVNLVETEIPPLTDATDEKPARSILSSLFARRLNADPLPEAESSEPQREESPPIPEPVAETESPRPRGRKKKNVESAGVIAPPVEEMTEQKTEVPILPNEAEPLEVKEEAKPGLFPRLFSLFRSRFSKPEISTSDAEEGEGDAPVIEPAVKQTPPSQPARMIFAEIGLQLRARRELISLTIEEVERHTRLRAVFVKALEEGALDKLPSPVQTRGMLANYANFLDLDTDVILLRFADYLQAQRYEKYAETPRDKIQTQVITSMPPLRSFIAGDLIFGVGMVVLLAALAIWGVSRMVVVQDGNAQATAPSIVEVLGGTLEPTSTLDVTFVPVNDNLPTIAADAGAVTVPDAATSAVTANVVVSMFAVERVFVRVSVDGKVAFEGRLAPRETKVFEADNQVVVLTGNAAALRINYNGRDLGLMGTMGEVVNRVYLISGVVTPTATNPPTATNTPLITFTPTLTNTPPATSTPGR